MCSSAESTSHGSRTGARDAFLCYHIRDAGSTAAQELAFTLADGFAYVEAATARGLDVQRPERVELPVAAVEVGHQGEHAAVGRVVQVPPVQRAALGPPHNAACNERATYRTAQRPEKLLMR